MLRHWICLCPCSNVEALIGYIFASLFRVFASLKFSLGYLSGKVHHVHCQLASFAQRSFKRLPHEWAHLTKEKPCNLNDADDADYIWISEYIWWHDIWWYQSAICENPFNRIAKLQSPPMRHARSLGGDTFSLTPRRRVRPSDSQGMVHGGICNRDRLHMLHHPCSWLQRMEWHRNCADLRLSCRSLWPQAWNVPKRFTVDSLGMKRFTVAVSHSWGRRCLHSSLGHMQASWI